jgi:hypothetical protein
MTTFGVWLKHQVVLEYVVNLVEGPFWSQELSDRLFVPPRQFEARRMSRKFLNWLLSNGVPVDKWIDQLESPKETPEKHAAPSSWAGGVGRAYPVGDGFVVKITTDNKEARFAASMIGKEQPFVAKIYDVRKIGDFQHSAEKTISLYAIVQEKVNTGIPRKYRIAGTAVYTYLDRFYRPVGDLDKVISYINSHSDILPTKYRQDPVVQQGIRSILSSVKDFYDTEKIHYADTIGPNLGFKGNKPRIAFFDLGRSFRFEPDSLPPVTSLGQPH